ncbi:MAG: DUF2029 domain-containing protein, partial [Lachnospiraceae bacterium]|nr:DUF2029 domain-containing protein [Lachnospiraceae bacterium]
MNQIRQQLIRYPERLFYLLSAAGTIGFVLICLLKGDGFDWISMGNTSDWGLTDFSRHIYFAADLGTTYKVGGSTACFPPFVYLLFHLLYRIIPTPLTDYDWLSYKDSPYIIIAYVMLMIFMSLYFLLIVQKIIVRTTKECVLLCSLLLCSLPFFMGAIERGNPVLLTLLLILTGLYLKDSPSAVKRECALLLLAIAVNFKLYPAVLGLLFLKEKRWKEALRFSLYSIVLFFVPFIWVGGTEGFMLYFDGLFSLTSLLVTEYSSFKHITFAILTAFHVNSETAAFAGMITGHICFILLLILAWITRVRWKELLYLSLIMSYYLPGNYRYTVVFMTIPLFFFIRDRSLSP